MAHTYNTCFKISVKYFTIVLYIYYMRLKDVAYK